MKMLFLLFIAHILALFCSIIPFTTANFVKKREICEVEFGDIFSVQCKLSYQEVDPSTQLATSNPVHFNQLSYFNSYRINPKLITSSFK